MNGLKQLESFLQRDLPNIRYATPASPSYSKLREAYILDSPAIPLAIVRPRTAEDVAAIVTWAVSAGVDFTIRSGGHDLFGRCFARDALAIDMRDIAFVKVDRASSTATIGGGILTGDLAAELTKHGLATAYGSVPLVGYVGWATHGGYGQFISNYGLGVDQILGAKMVNSEGEIVETDAEMLRAIRGGGGTIGVIVELTIKVCALDKVLAGMVLFESKHMTSTIKKFTTGYRCLTKRGFPSALGIQQSMVNTPMGTCFVIGFMWSSSDLEEGRSYLKEITSFGEVMHNSVKTTTIPEWLEASGEMVAKVAYGSDCTISVRELTDEVCSIIGREVDKMPNDTATLVSIHQLRGPSACSNSDSVFAARTPHYVIELIATSSDQQRAKSAWDWALIFRKALRETTFENILPSTYISLTPPEEASSPLLFGDRWEALAAIKKRHDPNNVFKHAMPKFNAGHL